MIETERKIIGSGMSRLGKNSHVGRRKYPLQNHWGCERSQEKEI